MNSFQGRRFGFSSQWPRNDQGEEDREVDRGEEHRRRTLAHPGLRAGGAPSELLEAPLQEVALGRVRRELQRSAVGRRRLPRDARGGGAGRRARRGTGGSVSRSSASASIERQPRAGAVGHRDRHGAVQLDDGARRGRRERSVEASRSGASRCPRAGAPARAARRSPPAPGRDRARAGRARRRARRHPRRSSRGPNARGPGPRAARGRPAASVRVARRECCSSISASRPRTSAWSGQQPVDHARRARSPRRTGRRARGRRRSWRCSPR